VGGALSVKIVKSFIQDIHAKLFQLLL